MANETGRRVMVGEKQLLCLVCGAERFDYREVKMNTSGMSFLNLEWANKSAEGVVCRTCGFVHHFMKPVAWEQD